MTHHCARLIVVAIAAVSFGTPITAQQEPTSPTTLETLVETLGGRVSQNEQAEVVEVYLSGPKVTDAGLVHLTGLTALERLDLVDTQITDAGLVHLSGLTALEELDLSRTRITGSGLVHLTGLTVPHPVPWTHICAMPPGVAHTPRAPRSACDTQASRDARSGCTAPRRRPRRPGRPRGSERFGRGSLAP